MFARDRGVCAVCGINTVVLRNDKRKLDFAARRRFEKEWGRRKHLWDADHIVPVAEGGGECDLSNMRTLCIKCHREATAALRQRLSINRSKAPAGAIDAAEPVEGAMPDQQAHQPRRVEDAGMRGLHQQAGKGRKNAGQTEGPFAPAGTPPLIKN